MDSPSEAPGSDPTESDPGASGLTPASQPLLDVRNVGRSFGGVIAVQDVSLQVNEGEVLGLMGDNGAGKSTLIKIVAGVLAPDAGEVWFDGRLVHLRSARDAQALGIETVHQNLALVDTFDAVANIYLGRELTVPWTLSNVLARRKMTNHVRGLLDELGVALPTLRLRAEFLSGGQRQTTAICRALAWGSRLVILDEPTAALGVQESQRVLRLIESMAKRGIAVLLISHNLEHVFHVCDRIIVLRQGRKAGERAVLDTQPNEIVELITGADSITARSVET